MNVFDFVSLSAATMHNCEFGNILESGIETQAEGRSGC